MNLEGWRLSRSRKIHFKEKKFRCSSLIKYAKVSEYDEEVNCKNCLRKSGRIITKTSLTRDLWKRKSIENKQKERERINRMRLKRGWEPL